jgi:hypothetical protein
MAKQMTLDERKRIDFLLQLGWTPVQIAKEMGRSKTTIIREIPHSAQIFSVRSPPLFCSFFASSRRKLPCEFGLTAKPTRRCSRLREAGAVLRRSHVG